MSAGQGPADRGGDAERLAAAIEQGTSPGASGDAELARDLEIVAMLRARSAAFDPHPADRARAKQRLMAALAQESGAEVTQRLEVLRSDTVGPCAAELTAPMLPLVDASESTSVRLSEDRPESASVEAPDVTAPRVRRSGRHSLPTRPGGRARGTDRPATRGLRRRFLAVGAAAMVALVALAGAGGFMSRDALPGDTLYAMKRLTESTGTLFTFDEQARAQRRLQLAATRLDELEQLVRRGGVDGSTSTDPELFETTMADFDELTGEGSRTLLATDDASGPALLGDLQAWASEQAARLSVLRSSFPEPSVAEADDSMALLDRLRGRTESLEARSSCSEVTSTVVDDLGRLPAEGTCSPRAAVADDPSTEADESQTQESGGTTTTAPDGTTDTTDTSDPAADASTSQESPDGVLPQLGPDGLPLPGPTGEGEGLTTSTSTSTTVPDEVDSDGQITMPLPLLPPMQLPPLLPGMSGSTTN